jgi:hypothetical protein
MSTTEPQEETGSGSQPTAQPEKGIWQGGSTASDSTEETTDPAAESDEDTAR